MSRFRRFVGIDFSAAADGGRKTWIAEGRPEGDRLRIDSAVRAEDLRDSGRAPTQFLPALQRWLTEQSATLVGLDFPFALPARLMPDGDWPAFAAGFAARFPDAETFRAACRERADGRELKRRCDLEARTPFCAYNLRLYRQTWWGIAGLLAPLAGDGRVGVAPTLRAGTAAVLLAEICPASTLKRLGLYRRAYKGRDAAAGERRTAILGAMREDGAEIAEDVVARAEADAGGDSLDAIIAAYAAWHVARTAPQALAAARDRLDLIEARVYF
jgi:hypothetical protein